MKATELRIGNLYDHNGIPKQATPNTIEEVWESERSWCKPIPLTEEILLKSCVRQDVKKFLFKVLDGYNWVEQRNGEYLWFINRFDFHLKAPLKYVHQLQNLYFSLTGEELNVEL